MKNYHKVWLDAHPERTLEWFKERMKDGFDIHHIDGDKTNNAPDNLVMIECRDHMRLHGMNHSRINLKEELVKKQERDVTRRLLKGESCYNLRYSTDKSWPDIAKQVYNSKSGQKALLAAKAYANYYSLEWPIVKQEVFRAKNYR